MLPFGIIEKHGPQVPRRAPKARADRYAGDGSVATRELGEFDGPRLQKEFFNGTLHPIDTKQ